MENYDFSFKFATIPTIHFGVRKISMLEEIIPTFGKRILLVRGKKSLVKSKKWHEIQEMFRSMNLAWSEISVENEPTPKLINESVDAYRDANIDAIVSIGGGSVLDAGKAISAMMLYDDPVEEFLEGVGSKKHDGRKIPFIACPTTSGTGSEATKNAVIRRVGRNGFKKSLRHDNLIPNFAIIDPEFVMTCPSNLTGACGMDAFTQLLESYVSTSANPMTDALAFSGLKHMIKNLVPAATDKANDIETRTGVAYGALISGITLANAGLGVVHGFASAVGGLFDVPHGVVCGTLMAEGNKITIDILRNQKEGPRRKLALMKYAEIGALMDGEVLRSSSMETINKYCDILIDRLETMQQQLGLKKFGHYGVKEEDINLILTRAGNKNNPASLNKDQMRELLKNRI